MEYFVMQSNAHMQEGTREHPFATISQAAAVAQSGDTIWMGDGIYREWVDPPRGGSDDTHRISYRALPDTHPVLSGAEVLCDWTSIGDQLYKTTLPRAVFGDYCP